MTYTYMNAIETSPHRRAHKDLIALHRSAFPVWENYNDLHMYDPIPGSVSEMSLSIYYALRPHLIGDLCEYLDK